MPREISTGKILFKKPDTPMPLCVKHASVSSSSSVSAQPVARRRPIHHAKACKETRSVMHSETAAAATVCARSPANVGARVCGSRKGEKSYGCSSSIGDGTNLLSAKYFFTHAVSAFHFPSTLSPSQYVSQGGTSSQTRVQTLVTWDCLSGILGDVAH